MLIGIAGKAGAGKDTVAAIIAPVHLVHVNGGWVDIGHVVDPAAAALRHREAFMGRAVQLSLADPIKIAAQAFYDFTSQQLWGSSEHRNKPDPRYTTTHVAHNLISGICARCGWSVADAANNLCETALTPRRALQIMGTEVGRQLYANTWVNMLIRRVTELTSKTRIEKPHGASEFKGSWLIGTTDLVVVPDVRFVNEVDAIIAAGGEVWNVTRPGAGLVGATAQHLSETEAATIPHERFAQHLHNDGNIEQLRHTVTTLLRG